MEYSKRLRKIRELFGLSQADIAFECNISPSAYGQIERKVENASIKTLEKIAKAIGVSLPFLLDINNSLLIK